MQRIILKKANLTPNFIGSWVMEKSSLCDDLITYFETHVEQQSIGETGGGKDLLVKDRIDISISPNQLNSPGNEIFKTYINNFII